MSTTTAAADSSTAPPLGPAPARLVDVVASEVTKGLSVRSTYWTMLATIVVSIGLGVLLCWAMASSWDEIPPEGKVGFDPVAYSLTGVYFGQIALAVLGVIVMTSEYGSGMIRSSLAAVPIRHRLLGAKAVVFGFAALAVGTATCLVAFFLAQAVLNTADLGVAYSDPDVARAVLGTGVFLALTGLFALAIGAILRHTAGAVTTVLGCMLLPTMLGPLLPAWWQEHLVQYLPFNAGGRISVTVTGAADQTGGLEPVAGLAVFALWAAVALVLAFVQLGRRDA